MPKCTMNFLQRLRIIFYGIALYLIFMGIDFPFSQYEINDILQGIIWSTIIIETIYFLFGGYNLDKRGKPE